MPRVVLGQVEESAPLTVAKLAEQVGISTSTLRTWDRRYGLGPSARTQGSHRRYTALDVARIQLVVQLIARGVSTCDAAREALQKDVADFEVDVQVAVDVPTLVAACRNGEGHVVRSILDRAVARDGLMRSWTDLISPARTELMRQLDVEEPGYSSAIMLAAKVMGVLRDIQTKVPHRESAKSVVLVCDHESMLPAHVLGLSLTHHNLAAKVLSSSTCGVARTLEEYLGTRLPALVAFIGARPLHAPIIEQLAVRDDLNVILVGAQLPCEVAPNVARLHTLVAASEEIPAIIAEN